MAVEPDALEERTSAQRDTNLNHNSLSTLPSYQSHRNQVRNHTALFHFINSKKKMQ